MKPSHRLIAGHTKCQVTALSQQPFSRSVLCVYTPTLQVIGRGSSTSSRLTFGQSWDAVKKKNAAHFQSEKKAYHRKSHGGSVCTVDQCQHLCTNCRCSCSAVAQTQRSRRHSGKPSNTCNINCASVTCDLGCTMCWHLNMPTLSLVQLTKFVTSEL